MQRGKRIMNLISQYKGLRKENYVLCFGRFVTAMGAMVRPMLPALFEPDKDQIPQIMERIFLQYYKLYEGADIFLDYLSDQSKSMSVLYRTQIS